MDDQARCIRLIIFRTSNTQEKIAYVPDSVVPDWNTKISVLSATNTRHAS